MHRSIEILHNKSQEFINLPSKDFLYTRCMNIGQWIRASREAAKLTQEQLAEQLGKTKSNVSGWENGRHEPSFGQIKEIARITGYAIAIPGIERLAHANVEFVSTGAPLRRVPVISYVQAGLMVEVVDPFSLGGGFEIIEVSMPCSARTFALRIRGNSMEPRFYEGDLAIVDPELSPKPGQFVVAKNTSEEATFKKYRPRGLDERGNEVFELVPLNDDYPTLHSERDHLHIIGVCIERRENMLR
ncbi:LexA family transcriptional regulator [Pandoraea sp. SD6-2]|uniref:LexA family protein n=1 Tax=Pandoraea sp. SD6-2 TaxID=1286093 RepID=UPI00032E5C42|nr:XRE family transcriptional regulator [Pandoraea sp. SD6-2]EON11936.1 phage repressor [Pandoraea sp. SD6-2]